MLRQAGALAAPPARVTQTVKFYEHGSQPVEILTSRQWFVRTVSPCWTPSWPGGASCPASRGCAAGSRNWVDGLLGRLVHQPSALLRGAVPAVVPGGPDGAVDHEHPLVPDEARLPVDPSTDVPSGYRGRP